jgi:hypothetical protein
MTDLTVFEDSQIKLITLSFVARAACDIITTASIAWCLNHQRDSNLKRYDYLLSRLPFLMFIIAR